MDREYHLLLEVFLIYIYLEFCNILLVLFCFANRMYVCFCQYETNLDHFHWILIGGLQTDSLQTLQSIILLYSTNIFIMFCLGVYSMCNIVRTKSMGQIAHRSVVNFPSFVTCRGL